MRRLPTIDRPGLEAVVRTDRNVQFLSLIAIVVPDEDTPAAVRVGEPPLERRRDVRSRRDWNAFLRQGPAGQRRTRPAGQRDCDGDRGKKQKSGRHPAAPPTQCVHGAQLVAARGRLRASSHA